MFFFYVLKILLKYRVLCAVSVFGILPHSYIVI